MLIDMLSEASIVGFLVGILVAQFGLWLKLRSFINAQTKFLADRMTEQNRHVNPLLENIRDQIRQALREARSDPLGEHPYRESPANMAALPDFEHMQPEPVVLTDWVPGTACPFCATDTDQEDPTQAAARPADGATPARPYLTWHCHYCESEWNTPPRKPHPIHPSYTTVDVSDKTGTEALAEVRKFTRPIGPRSISE